MNLLFSYTFFLLLFHQTSIATLINTFHEFKVMKKVIKTETFNVNFHNIFIRFWIILVYSTFFIDR